MKHLLELVTSKNIIFQLEAESKEEVIRKLVQHGVQMNILQSEHEEELVTSLMNREKSMSTGIGSGVAIPHCSVSLVQELKVVIGVSQKGIAFEAMDKMPVHIFILLIVPKEQFQEHIKTLALIAKTLNQKEEREKFISSSSYKELMDSFKKSQDSP